MGPTRMTRRFPYLWIILVCLFLISITMYYEQSCKLKETEQEARQQNYYEHFVLNKNNTIVGANLQKGYIQTDQNNKILDTVLSENNVHLIFGRVLSGGMLDPLNEYHVISHLLTPTITVEETKRMDITICTHTTTSNLHYLLDLSKRWDAPISVAVFTFDIQIRTTLRQILYLHVCHPSIRSHVTFNLVIPRFNQTVITYESLNPTIECTPMGHIFNVSRSKNFQDTGHPYPHNTLRSVAITHSNTDYVFMIDIDFLPSKGLARDFQRFMKDTVIPSIDETVFVIPAFEANRDPTFVNDKSDIIREVKEGNIRAFYASECSRCQKATNYTRWLSMPRSSDVGIAYQVAHVTSWEPFYIAKKRNLPLYDGRFKQYGFDRVSQGCETHISGFQFVVMNNCFIVHDGFKTRKTFHASQIQELKKNKVLYEKFKNELRMKYPNSRRFC